ncbi:MAG: hypothetical protein OM95_07755 [Bdellovibrio sp. ArHS]|uniref:hypothetical protein n=1 Tax=Bdellovibrio sp. ArHS TaxID=1569284 RepID=UPI0005827AD7|nr:hypothetical protein [Bdellovibrio sp. ArHS]KHD88687.1 MAG: hypothetical protein OM95_07755 [Bdellovibrio sp. ArHS]
MKSTGFLLLVLISTSSFAWKNSDQGRLLQPQFSTAPACEERPEFLSEMRADFVGALSKLPETLLVARDAEFYVEGQSQQTKLYGYQSFLKGPYSEPQVLCGSSTESGAKRFSLFAPTLIDTYKNPKVGQSLWQFQMMSDGAKFSFWNLKSPSFPQKEQLESWIQSTGAQYKLYQRAHNEYELLLVKKDGETTQYLSVRYDAVKSLK